MAAQDGVHRLGPESGHLLIKTSRTGLGSKAGHDLTIEVTRWEGSAMIDTATPGNSSLSVDAHVDSFEVREGRGGVKPLTDSDRADIKSTLRDKILHARRHPTIAFRSSAAAGTPESFTVDGELTIMGNSRPVTLAGRLSDDTEPRAQGSATVRQSEWGITPYSAFFGALKLADDVRIEFNVSLGG